MNKDIFQLFFRVEVNSQIIIRTQTSGRRVIAAVISISINGRLVQWRDDRVSVEHLHVSEIVRETNKAAEYRGRFKLGPITVHVGAGVYKVFQQNGARRQHAVPKFGATILYDTIDYIAVLRAQTLMQCHVEQVHKFVIHGVEAIRI